MPSTEAKQQKITSIVVGIIQHSETKEILIAKRRSDQHLAGLWEFPGGKVNAGEDFFHALKREIDEEVGVQIQAAYPLSQITHHYADKSVCLNFWYVTHFDGDATAKEGQELKWVKPSELTEYHFPEANETIINALNLPSFLMITPDCDISKLDDFVQLIKTSMAQNNLKQILFRSKELNDEEYFAAFKRLKVETDSVDCRIIVNRAKIDKKLADNWHLTSLQLYEHQKKPIIKGLLSASCHTLDDLKQAEKIGVDFVFLSAVNFTHSHPSGSTLGWYQFKKLANKTRLPVYALGGVSRDELMLARYHGAIGLAGISTFIKRSELI